MARMEKEMEQDVLVKGVVSEPAAPAPKKDREFKLTIHSEDSAEGRGDVPVGLNGKFWQIKRNFEVVVPEGVIEILKNTVVNTTGEHGEALRIPRYNITYEPV